MPDDNYAERLARGEPRAVLHAYGHPGAYERVTQERNEARAERDLQRARADRCEEEEHRAKAERNEAREQRNSLSDIVRRNRAVREALVAIRDDDTKGQRLADIQLRWWRVARAALAEEGGQGIDGD